MAMLNTPTIECDRERPRCRAAEQREELAPVHCPVSPVLPTERIAYLSMGETAALRDFSRAFVAQKGSDILLA